MADAPLVVAWSGLAARSGLSNALDLGQRLIAAWSEPHRRYHAAGHLRWMLAEIDRRAGNAADPDLLRLAAWFHDAVYVPLAKDNEERSALWAEEDLAIGGMAAKRATAVARLVRMTADHHAGLARRTKGFSSISTMRFLARRDQFTRDMLTMYGRSMRLCRKRHSGKAAQRFFAVSPSGRGSSEPKCMNASSPTVRD